MAIGVLFIALFDTLRVFILRILKGKSPLSPDRLHVHHIIVDSGLTHLQATFVLIIINLFVILICIKFQSLGNLFLLWVLLLIGLILNGVLYLINQRNLSKIFFSHHEFLYIFLGGGIACVLRYSLSLFTFSGVFSNIPLSTLFVNALSSFILAYEAARFEVFPNEK